MSINQQSRQNKIVLITGAASGIGLSIALAYANLNFGVIIADKDNIAGKNALKKIKKTGSNAYFIQIDLSESDAGSLMIQKALDLTGRIDILINNARSGIRGDIAEESEVNWDTTLAVCLKSPYFASQTVIPSMGKIGGGSIINIASTTAFRISKETPSYHAAKAALVHVTKYLATIGGAFGVRVNAVAPGFIVKNENFDRFESDSNTSYREHANVCHPVGHVGRTKDVVNTVLYLSSFESSFVTGQTVIVDGGYTLKDPWNATWDIKNL